MKRPGARYGTRGRVPTYIGGASPIGTCMYGNGNTYGKGKASLTRIQGRVAKLLKKKLLSAKKSPTKKQHPIQKSN